MKSKTVKTREELARAQKSGVDEIIVVGDMADKLKKAQKISKLGKWGLAVLTACLGAAAISAPITGGISLVAAIPATATTGVGVVALITASMLGIALVYAIFKDYEEIECSPGRLVLRKKAK
jgi:thiamine monophosphate synthase